MGIWPPTTQPVRIAFADNVYAVYLTLYTLKTANNLLVIYSLLEIGKQIPLFRRVEEFQPTVPAIPFASTIAKLQIIQIMGKSNHADIGITVLIWCMRKTIFDLITSEASNYWNLTAESLKIQKSPSRNWILYCLIEIVIIIDDCVVILMTVFSRQEDSWLLCHSDDRRSRSGTINSSLENLEEFAWQGIVFL